MRAPYTLRRYCAFGAKTWQSTHDARGATRGTQHAVTRDATCSFVLPLPLFYCRLLYVCTCYRYQFVKDFSEERLILQGIVSILLLKYM